MATLTFKEILELIDRVAERDVSAVEIESAGVKVRIEGRHAEQPAHQYIQQAPQQQMQQMPQMMQMAPAAPQPAVSPAAAQTLDDAEQVDPSWHIITSPIVGTFYRAANPESETLASVGDQVTKGKVLCIIEAMKLMNEIESDLEGVVAKVFPQNGQPVEYGEKLFAIRM